MSKTRSKPKFLNGSLVRKIDPKYPSVRGFQAKKKLGARFVSYGLDFGQIGTVIKTENRPQKRKDRERHRKREDRKPNIVDGESPPA